MPRAKAAPVVDLDDDDDPPIQHRRVPAAGARPPVTTAARSVFDVAKPQPVPAALIHIRRGVPMPPRRISAGSKYREIVAIMAVGDMVELPVKQGRSLMEAAKTFGAEQAPVRKFSYRTLAGGLSGVWRVA
ncbi:MAG: hypothetical protein IAE86_06895 [Burkholderiaceae bacterium]|nr:hypothetical protein [Burkholderiaceae bacterium]